MTPSRRLYLTRFVATLLVTACSGPPGARPYASPPVAVVPPPARIEYVPVAPPAPRYEAAGPAPTAGYVWIEGYWNWIGGRHDWVPGHWEAPRRGQYWVPYRWEQRGSLWSLRGGYWQSH